MDSRKTPNVLERLFSRMPVSWDTFQHYLGRGVLAFAVPLLAMFVFPLLLKGSLDPMNPAKKDAQKRAQAILDSLQRRHTKRKAIRVDGYESMIANDIVMPENIDVSFDDIGGLEEIKLKLQEAVILPLRRPDLFARGKLLKVARGVLLYGEPGTGKTMLAKAIAKTSEATFINFNVSNIMQKWLGETEKLVQATFSLAAKVQPCIIFIDEADSLFQSRSSGDHEVLDRVKALFMTLWDGLATDSNSQITIIAATNRPWTIDEAIQRRMPHTFHVGMPDVKQREHILKIILKDEAIEEDFDIKRLAKETEGYSGSDLMALSQAAARAPIRELMSTSNPESKSMRHLRLDDFLDAKEVVGATGSSANTFRINQEGRRVRNEGNRRSGVTNVFNFNMFSSAPSNNF